uniref:Helitron_like_N domain-containing protein n=1 Tax=Macrostomum lignano TaxID=282301 RepID=A0A1I8H099_9PLAT
MPKRGNISRSTRAASAAKKRRASETPEERQHRLEAQRQRTAESREAEDETVHQHRLEAQRQRQNQIRAAESADDRDRRLNAQAGWRRDRLLELAHQPHVLGRMDRQCPHCSALRWKDEPASICCHAGKTVLEPRRDPPDVLKRLLTGQHPDSSQFLKDIRKYNGALHMTSLGAKQREQPGWNPSFILHGQMHHRIGSLLPDPGNEARFCQVFFVDQELQTRLQWATGLNGRLLEELQAMLHACNGYVCSLKSAVDLLRNDPQLQSAKVVINPDARPSGEHARRFNLPECSEVGILTDLDDTEGAAQTRRRDVILRLRGGGLQSICDTHRSYDPLEYVLLFPFGEDGWSIGLKQDRGITIMKYYAFMIQVRPGQFNSLHYGGRLFQQYLVDQAAKIESERLNYIRLHQKDLLSERLRGLRGLPHVHALLWLAVKLKPDQYDAIISAELPDPVADADLHKLVAENLLHGWSQWNAAESSRVVHGEWRMQQALSERVPGSER